ncbi:glycosyltransferase family 4 protein [Winogradskyella poriferorum]|uniref:glycosyltransferase family 4 protein n=1 Tax=Winogradskyella poriferorum TaxID=307627 RepID=UPI003D64CBD1
MKKILIFGPIGDQGGRELETGFIAKSLSKDFEVRVLSSGNLTSKSQIFDFIPTDKVLTLNQLIYKSSIWFRFLAFVSALKSNKIINKFSFVSNSVARKTGYRTYAIKKIQNEVLQSDLIILCAQLSSNYLEEIVSIAKKKGIKTVLRTSMTIKEADIQNKDWLSDISLFIHHSLSNAQKLNSISNYNFKLIDQCTYSEFEMLNLSLPKKISTFLYAGRISEEKGILEFVNCFKKVGQDFKLIIIGDGPLSAELISKTNSLDNITYLGFKPYEELTEFKKKSDVIVIPSYEESGPLIGLEAMASARLIISTKVGAMPERLKDLKNQFWIKANDCQSIEKILIKLTELSDQEVTSIALENRIRYQKHYLKEHISGQYKNAIFNL